MSWIDIVRIVAIAVGILVVAAGVILLFVRPSNLEGFFDVKELPEVSFETLERPGKPNSYLVCPPDLCEQAQPDEIAPVFAVPVERLRARLLELVDRTADVQNYRMDLEDNKFTFVERTPAMRFPDVITVQLLPAGEGSSTLAIYSRSVYGRSDLGVNKRRVKRWLAALS